MPVFRSGFTGAAMVAGIRRITPLMIGTLPFGLVMGVLAQGQGLSLLETTLMSALVYAGSAQLLVVQHWGVPAPVLAAAATALIVNLRLVLMGPVIAPWLDRLRGWRLWGSLFLMADQNWALSVEEMKAGRGDAGFLFGAGVVMWVTWVACTVFGYLMGEVVQPPPGHPIFFAALALFVSLLAMLWRGRVDLLPWLVAAAAALLVQHLVSGGSWHILAGALAGSAAGVLRDRTRAA